MSGDGLASIPLYQNMLLNSTPTVLISLDDLMKSNVALQATESANKLTLETFDSSILMNNLHMWAGAGYPDSYPVYQFGITTPPKTLQKYNCSDGTPRTIWDYVVFCLGYPIQTLVTSFQQRVAGMNFSFSLEDVPTIVLKIHVSKA
jgi:hypothetical protein